MKNLRLKRHESFSIRDGWFEKAINTIEEQKSKGIVNIFYKHDGIKYLGIGANMVKGLKYWLLAAKIITVNSNEVKLSPFGEFIYRHDPYLQKEDTWFLIHCNLVNNFDNAPTINLFFNLNYLNIFDRDELLEQMLNYLKAEEYIVNRELLIDDITTIIRSYCDDSDFQGTPEDNYSCPLSNLKLFKKNKTMYHRNFISHIALDYRIVYYALCQFDDEKKDFIIDDILDKFNNPCRVFNIEKNLFFQYIEEMQNGGLIKLSRTAGLNTVSFRQVDLYEVLGELYE